MARFHQTTLSGTSADPTPTSYKVNEIILTNNLGDEWDITSLVAFLEIFESIYTSSIEAVLNIADGISFFEQAFITGNEKIVLSVQQSSEDTSRRFDLELYIAEVDMFSRSSPGLNTYRFVCFSKHMYINSISRVNRAFKNTIGGLIETICKRDLLMEKINSINTSSKNIITGIYPRMRPLTAINWLLRNAVEDGTPFFFYETTYNGINLSSYKELLDQDVYRVYNHNPAFKNQSLTSESYEEIASRIRRFSSSMNLSKLSALSEGAYSGTLHELDIYNKTYSKKAFEYDSLKHKLDTGVPFNRETTFKDLTFDKTKDTKHYYISKNSSNVNYHTPAVDILLRNGYLENLDLITQDISIAGDFELTCGKIIELNIPKSTDTDALELDVQDKVHSGKYLVESITHNFRESEYTMEVKAVKDTFKPDWKLQG